jgi:hypothetical protein
MFGKYANQFNSAKKWLGKASHDVYNGLDTGSKWLGKAQHDIRDTYAKGKDTVKRGAAALDKELKLNGALSALANVAISTVENNPYAKIAEETFDRVEDFNKNTRSGVFDNRALKKFINK